MRMEWSPSPFDVVVDVEPDLESNHRGRAENHHSPAQLRSQPPAHMPRPQAKPALPVWQASSVIEPPDPAWNAHARTADETQRDNSIVEEAPLHPAAPARHATPPPLPPDPDPEAADMGLMAVPRGEPDHPPVESDVSDASEDDITRHPAQQNHSPSTSGNEQALRVPGQQLGEPSPNSTGIFNYDFAQAGASVSSDSADSGPPPPPVDSPVRRRVKTKRGQSARARTRTAPRRSKRIGVKRARTSSAKPKPGTSQGHATARRATPTAKLRSAQRKRRTRTPRA